MVDPFDHHEMANVRWVRCKESGAIQLADVGETKVWVTQAPMNAHADLEEYEVLGPPTHPEEVEELKEENSRLRSELADMVKTMVLDGYPCPFCGAKEGPTREIHHEPECEVVD